MPPVILPFVIVPTPPAPQPWHRGGQWVTSLNPPRPEPARERRPVANPGRYRYWLRKLREGERA